MSGGGKVPAAPDTRQYQGNANQTFNTATSNAGQTMAAAGHLNDAASQHLQSVVGEQLPMLNQVNSESRANMGSYQNNFLPLQAEQAQQAKDYTSGANIDMLRGRAVADANASQEAARRNSAAALAAEGVDPASIHGAALDRQAGITGAAQTAGAANNSYLNTMDTGRQLVNNANQLGLQVGQQGTNEALAGSNIGNQLVNTETGADTGQVNNLTAANSYLNTGVNANNSAADIQHTGYQDQLAQYNAQQTADKERLGSITGALGGIGGLLTGGAGASTGAILTGMSMLGKGGPVSEKGALPVPPVPGSTDTKPALLTPGEFVIPKDVVSHKGHEFFHKLIDSTRLKANERRAIPQPVFAHQSNH